MDTENLIRLVRTVSESELTGFKYEEKGVKLQLEKKYGRLQSASTPESATGSSIAVEIKKEVKQEGNIMKSPLVGTFYAAPSEQAEPFVTVGDVVKKGQPLAIIEAMKLMNEIESEYDGTVEEILVENGQIVEYGQPLFRIR